MDLETVKQGQSLLESYGPYGFSVFLLVAIVGAATWAYVKIINPEREAERAERKEEREQWSREREEHRQAIEAMRIEQREDRDKFIAALAKFDELIRNELSELSAKIDRQTEDRRRHE